jgi:hypothetical protein
MFEILNILAVEQDYGIELTAADFHNFDWLGKTFANAAKFQEILFEISLDQTLIRANARDIHTRHSSQICIYVVKKKYSSSA